MQVIGRPTLLTYAARHPEAAAPLRALVALLEAAAWRSAEDLRCHWGAIARCDDAGRVSIDLAETGCTVVLKVSYPRQLVYIETVSPSHEETRREPERSRRASDSHRGRLRPRLA